MLPKERQKEIALEIIGKMNDRGNYADPRIRFVNSETCIVEGYFGLDDRGNVVYTMVKIINQDMLDIDRGVLCHQVNCQKAMGSGIALQIRKKWPKVYVDYAAKSIWHLGDCQLVEVSNDLWVANCAGQFRYGRDKQHTNYLALETSLSKAYSFAKKAGLPCYVPYKIGCNLAGGDWAIATYMIESMFPEMIICQRKEDL
jgi:O-acetyl-ADP-ribose deacetylase (regulator of RNase III)